METGGPGGAGVCRAPVGGARSSRCRGRGRRGPAPRESSGRASRGFCAVCLRPPSPRARASLQEARAPRFHRLGNCTTYSTSKLGTGRREGFVKKSSQEGKRPHLPLPGTRGKRPPRPLPRRRQPRARLCTPVAACVRARGHACACACACSHVCACACPRASALASRVCARARVHVCPCVCARPCVHAHG